MSNASDRIVRLAHAILAKREEIERSQEDVAHDAAVSVRHYQKIEGGLVDPKLSTLYRDRRCTGREVAEATRSGGRELEAAPQAIEGYASRAEEILMEPKYVRDGDRSGGGIVEHLADGSGILIDPIGRSADELADEVLRWAREIGMDCLRSPDSLISDAWLYKQQKQ